MTSRNELLVRALEIERELFRRRARQSVLGFTLYTSPTYKVNWHHKHLCSKLDDWIEGRIKRLMVFMPPQNGKSELVSRRAPAYIFGRYPDARLIGASYADALASRMNRDVQRIMDSPEYLELFPETRLFGENVRMVAQGSWLRNNDIFEIVNHRGSYRSAGIGTGITGMPADFTIIDDPIKDAAQAGSKTYRDALWEWYSTALYSRLSGDGRVLLTLTRWSDDDLAARLLELQRVDPLADQWTVVCFPAIKEDDSNPDDPRQIGEALWPERYPLEFLEKVRKNSERTWNALYQQRPTSASGGHIQRSWLQKTWRVLPDRFDQIIQSWDMTFKDGRNSDFVVGQVWGKKDASFYLIDQFRDRVDFNSSKQALKTLSAKHPKAVKKLVEDKANGPAIINSLQKELSGIVARNPGRSNKSERLDAVSGVFEAGNVYLPDPSIAPWIHEYIEEMVNFPNWKNDDQVDATTQALSEFVLSNSSGTLTEAMTTSNVRPLASGMEW